ncbi:hypothetical protein SNEBB_002579 [Seison nebaliae]|nr:hypothetical protein SNEBB_002579 [Seison nebaliae]
MVLKKLTGDRLLNELFRSQYFMKFRDWRVLILDKLATRILSSALKMHDIMNEYITIVEDIEKNREPLPGLEAIYFIEPTTKSIDYLIKDQQNASMYKYIHIFFTHQIPEDLFRRLCKSKVANRAKTFCEINISFLPYESYVFNLDRPSMVQAAYNPSYYLKDQTFKNVTKQLTSLCEVLDECPLIRYDANYSSTEELAQMLNNELKNLKKEKPTLGVAVEKQKSQLILVARGTDPISSLLHELTLQAMSYDLLSVKNDVYKCQTNKNELEREVVLDEENAIWKRYRHKHIAETSTEMSNELREFIKSKKHGTAIGTEASIKQLNILLKAMPQYRKELNDFSFGVSIAHSCLVQYQDQIEKLCEHEQNLVMGENADGLKIKDQMSPLVTILTSDEYCESYKVRLIALYIIHKNGVSLDNFQKLCGHSKLSENSKKQLKNLSLLGVNVTPTSSNKQTFSRKVRSGRTYNASRWTPIIKDILENAIDDSLDEKRFPFIEGRPINSSGNAVRNYGQWHRATNVRVRTKPRLICYVMGGLTYSEMRCAYEIMYNVNDDWDIIIGGDHIITPNDFLKDLETIDHNHEATKHPICNSAIYH